MLRDETTSGIFDNGCMGGGAILRGLYLALAIIDGILGSTIWGMGSRGPGPQSDTPPETARCELYVHKDFALIVRWRKLRHHATFTGE